MMTSNLDKVNAEISRISLDLLNIETVLNSNIPSTLWISDLHGAGDRFVSILKGRFGLLYQTCKEALPKTLSPEKLNYLGQIIRKRSYFKDELIRMDRQDVIQCLVQVLRYKVHNVDYIEDFLKSDFRDIILRLTSGMPVPDMVYENDLIAIQLIEALCNGIMSSLLDKIVVLGDIFDRGPQPDKIIRILSSPSYRNMVQLVLGNHDILWMGACTGNKSLIAESLRVSYRYNNFAFLKRIGIDCKKLEEFALRVYPAEEISGNFKAKSDLARSVEKALAIIQFKLEEQCIKQHPEFEMEHRLNLDKLATKLKTKKTKGLLDSVFPTLDLDNPDQLIDVEQEIINDLTEQFVKSERLRQLMKFFFNKGQTYSIYNNILNIHALIPSTKDGEFEEFLGHKGKALFDFIQKRIEHSGYRYLSGDAQKESDQALFFYLWCGSKSPFYGRNSMKTFERYFFADKSTYKEKNLYWRENITRDEFKQKILKEFSAERIVHGHTPVNYEKGQTIASEDSLVINIDGGFAKAYFDRGHALVHTPHQLYAVILPTPTELKEAAKQNKSAPIQVEIIHDFPRPVKIKDTNRGKKLTRQKNNLIKLMASKIKP